MSTDDMWQQLQYGDKTVRVKAYLGVEDNQKVPCVFVDDIQHHFQDATKFMLSPKRFDYRPGETVEVVIPSSTLSPRLLTRQNTFVLQSTSVSPAVEDEFQQSATLFKDYVKAVKESQREKVVVNQSGFQQCFSALQTSSDQKLDFQHQMNEMKQQIDSIHQNQQVMLQMQQQALDRLAVIQGRIQALLTQTYELHEYPIPRLFIILPNNTSMWDSVNIFNNQFQLYFLCECGEHTKSLDDNKSNIPHHIHIAKHEGYDLKRPIEFFQKYGKYMLTLLEMIKYGVTISGFAIPAQAAVSAPGAIDMFRNSLNTISQSAVNQSIEFLQSLSSKDLQEQDATNAESFTGQEVLEGADLRHLEAFIKAKDQHRALGNLYRIVTQQGHVKWVCINHYRLTYKEQGQQAFITAVELNGGDYDPHLGKVTVSLGSKIQATGFFDALAKARRVNELIVTFDWEGTTSDLEAFEDTLKCAVVSILRLDIRRFRASFGAKLLSSPVRQQALARIINLPSMKIIDIVLPMDLVELFRIQPKRLSCLPKLSFEVVSGPNRGKILRGKGLRKLAETLKTDSTLTILYLNNNSIEDNGAVALSVALKTNSNLTTLHLTRNPIGESGAVALSEALKTNSTLTTLHLGSNWFRENGVVALFETLKTNSTLTTLHLDNNPIGDNGAVALSETLKTNSTLTTLHLESSWFRENGAVTLSEALKTNSTLTTLSLNNNAIGDNGAVALSEALKTNSTLTTLRLNNNWIGDNGAMALSEALKTSSTLTTLHLGRNWIKDKGTVALLEAHKTNSTLTSLHLDSNSNPGKMEDLI
ncbi:hypothetical protein BG015_011079 [Linnemannia schmuckeri]|uniref:RNI-like protein n=1 Tax=Linnemannia schmuckeri TaxID=64567 RepID=A0A9P5V857_9FUNG|nr:hypothetical protein BG015_011079 [Linnemannia schmuckeri]